MSEPLCVWLNERIGLTCGAPESSTVHELHAGMPYCNTCACHPFIGNRYDYVLGDTMVVGDQEWVVVGFQYGEMQMEKVSRR